MTRRSALLASVSVLISASGALAISLPDFFRGQKKEYVGYEVAEKLVSEAVLREIELSEKYYGVKRSPEEIEQITKRMWDHTQYALSEYYAPKLR